MDVLTRGIALYTAFSMAALPFTAAMADNAAAQKAREEAWRAVNNYRLPTESGGTLDIGSGINGTLTDPAQQKIDLKELFPNIDTDPTRLNDLKNLYGDDSGIAAASNSRLTQLKNESSPAGEAYRTFDTSLYSQSRPDLTHDPLFHTTDLMKDFLDTKVPPCNGSQGTGKGTRTTCLRPTEHPKQCTGKRSISIYHQNFSVQFGGLIPNHGVQHLEFDLLNGTYKVLPGDTASNRVVNVPRMNAELSKVCNASTHIRYLGQSYWSPPIAGKDDGTYVLTLEQAPSCENGMVGRVYVRDIKGGGTVKQGVSLTWDMYAIKEDLWSWDRTDCPDFINEVQSGACSGTVTCTSNPSNCVTVEGLTFCGPDLQPVPGSLPRGCMAIDVEKRCGGSVIQTDQCAALENDPSCGFITSRCVQKGADGKCLVTEDTYECNIVPQDNAACLAARALTDLVQDCEVVETETSRTVNAHEPLYKTCDYLRRLTVCSVSRDLSVVKSSGSVSFHRDCFINDTITYKAPWTRDETLVGSNYGWIHGQSFTTNFTLSADATLQYSGNNTSASIVQYPSAGNDWTVVVELSGPGKYVEVPNPAYDQCLAQNGGNADKCANIPKTITELQCPAGTYLSGSVTVSGDRLVYGENYNPAEPENNPCLKEEDDWTEVYWQCDASGPAVVGGYTIPGSMLPPLFPGDNGQCLAASSTYDPKDYNFGTRTCWTDPQGVHHCLENYESTGARHPPGDNCDALENDPSCTFVDQRCVLGSQGYGGFCYVMEHRFDCGSDTPVKVNDTERTYSCPGKLQCMGEECLPFTEETNGDFAKAAALANAAQQAQMDLNCSDPQNPASCKVFSGHHMECKKAVGGWQDCCVEPRGVSLGDYIEMIMAVGSLDSNIMALDGIEAFDSVVGAWETLRTPVVNTWSAVTDPFTSTFNSVTGNIVPTVTEKVESTITAAKQELISGIKQWTTQVFDEGVSEFLFGSGGAAIGEKAGTEGAQKTGEQMANQAANSATGGISSSGGLVSMISTVLNVVMIAYAIYAILDILVNIIWECDMEEFQLGVQKRLHNCAYVGSYCKGFLCVEKRESYCCFNSPLARIINEQAKPQLGQGFGNPKHPNCRGLTISELAQIDWSRIDLSEWIDLLMLTGNYPNRHGDNPSLDQMTGSGAFSSNANSPRPDSETRTRARIDPLQLDQIRSNVTRELYP